MNNNIFYRTLKLSFLFLLGIFIATSVQAYKGDKESFKNFSSTHAKGWPTPTKIAYFDPSGGEQQVIRYAHWKPVTDTGKGCSRTF